MKHIFESSNIIFVNVSVELVDDYLIMVNDIEHVDRFIGGDHREFTKEDEIKWVNKKIEASSLVYSMIEKASGAFIGNIELMDASCLTEKELGIAITYKMQDKGYGTEAIKAILDYGFNTLNLDKIILRTRTFNKRAIHVYKKCGFKEYNRDDTHIYMEITKEKR